MLQLGWEKAYDDTGIELAWWSARVREGIAELLTVPGDQSSRSGSSRTTVWYIGWKLA